MKEELEIKGYWYLPDSPENHVAGILKYKPNEKIRLELIGSFETPIDFIKSFHDESRVQGVIYGESEDSKAITLIGCSKYGSLNFDCSFPMCYYTVNYIMRGIHLPKLDSLYFNKITVELPKLTHWVNHFGLSFGIPFSSDKKMKGYDLSYRIDSQKEIEADIDGEISISLRHSADIPDTHQEEITINQSYYLTIYSNDNLDWFSLLAHAKRFRSFLSIATLSEIDFNNLTIFSPHHFQELKRGEKIFHPINIYFKQSRIQEESAGKRAFREFLFTHDKIEDEFPEVIKRWYAFDTEMMPILNHLTNSVKIKNHFSSVDFLVIVQALEGYHRRFFDKKKHVKRKLESRIQNLLNEFRSVKKIEGVSATVVADSRNYYSHLFVEYDQQQVLFGEKLYYLTNKLKFLLLCCILKEIGFDGAKVK